MGGGEGRGGGGTGEDEVTKRLKGSLGLIVPTLERVVMERDGVGAEGGGGFNS